MSSKNDNINESNNQTEKLNKNIIKTNLLKIKSSYILKRLLSNLQKNKSLSIIKYTKKVHKKLGINITDFKEFSEKYSPIEIEVIPIKNKSGIFIKDIPIQENKYYHIYFNNSNTEIKRNYIYEYEKINKVKIVIDHQIKSLEHLFEDCKCIESIIFKKFTRNTVTNMCSIFSGCTSLKEINLSKFNTVNVKDFSLMFFGCPALKELNLSNLNTNNAIDMAFMFSECSLLKELNLSNFNTDKVCDMRNMFSDCSSLQELNISNFNFTNVMHKYDMFLGCSEELKNKIRNRYPYINLI